MPIKKLREFLDENKIKYIVISHSLAYTAMEVAASAHISGKDLAKTVIVKIDGKMAMTVLPASCKVVITLLKEATGANEIELAKEREFKDIFPECEIGAMPPFGNLYEMEIFADESLKENEEIAFNACSHTELIKMAYRDFERLVNPKIVKFCSR